MKQKKGKLHNKKRWSSKDKFISLLDQDDVEQEAMVRYLLRHVYDAVKVNQLVYLFLNVLGEFDEGVAGVVSRARPFTQSLRWERVWSNSHSDLVSTGPGISWTGNWFRVAVTLDNNCPGSFCC